MSADLGRPDLRPPPVLRPAGVAATYTRVIIVAILLLIVMAGVRVAAPAAAGRGPLRQDALALGIAFEVALAGLEVALSVRGRRSPEAGRQAMLLRKGLQSISGVLMLAIALIAGADLLGSRHPGKIMQALTGNAKPPRQHARPPKVAHLTAAPFPFGDLVYSLLALVVLVAIVACVLIVRRRTPALEAGFLEDADVEEAEELRQAVESGREALHAVDDARAAIIACYVAMEGSLAKAGTTRAAAETPDELLGRAVNSGLLRGPAAGQLTVLFYEARFSTHPLPDTVRDDARQALDAILAELADNEPAGPDPVGPDPAGLAPGGASR